MIIIISNFALSCLCNYNESSSLFYNELEVILIAEKYISS